jgi:predicted amidophosphoribosyltransferase
VETSSYRYCGVCGQPLEPGATVCGNCGAAVDGADTGATPTGEQTMAMPAAAAGAGAAGAAGAA